MTGWRLGLEPANTHSSAAGSVQSSDSKPVRVYAPDSLISQLSMLVSDGPSLSRSEKAPSLSHHSLLRRQDVCRLLHFLIKGGLCQLSFQRLHITRRSASVPQIFLLRLRVQALTSCLRWASGPKLQVRRRQQHPPSRRTRPSSCASPSFIIRSGG